LPKLEKTVSEIPNKHNRLSILHVENDLVYQEIFKLIIMDIDYRFDIDSACSIDEAFAKLQSKRYDVIVSGFFMPTKDGCQFLKELRETKNQIPFVLFTIRSKEELPPNALNFEFTHYICKYGEPETIYKEIANVLLKSIK
jgi:DNA-binding NarL/FixJ family response regulator